ncbi:MAG: O-linked N-acetylglucosamine transferase, SPINDLY family protein [Elainellaceae cyanobacterium]
MESAHAEIRLQADSLYQQGDYKRAALTYENLLEGNPQEKTYCWQLGLMRLLQGLESDAQLTWLIGMSDGDEQEIDQWTDELANILNQEANRQLNQENYKMAWLIRRHLHEVRPDDVNNILNAIHILVKTEDLTEDALAESGILECLESETIHDIEVDSDLLIHVFNEIPYQAYGYLVMQDIAKYSSQLISKKSQLITTLLTKAKALNQLLRQTHTACKYAEICIEIAPENIDVLNNLSYYYVLLGRYDEAIEMTRRSYQLAKQENLYQEILSASMLMKSLMTAGGNWGEATTVFDQLKFALQQLYEKFNTKEGFRLYEGANRLYMGEGFLGLSCYYFPYLEDAPRSDRALQNQVAQIYQEDRREYVWNSSEKYQEKAVLFPHQSSCASKSKLRIGYASRSLRQHSVGWLSRWLFHHHNHKEFEVFSYFINIATITDFTKKWFVNKSASSSYFEGDFLGIAESIYEDKIDILIDLDSITEGSINAVCSLKPAPIQVTWLGLDATGMPAVDYFIADPYVLPDDAQDYYAETIWRLPQTYIAVDGFEVGVPTLRRDHLNIPNDAVIYFSSQTAHKRHPEHIRLQMRILKGMPNSYFLIKGIGDENFIRDIFTQLAEEEGVNVDQLRFLSRSLTELDHRANMQIADVVLDTFPYNGATTTLETLWLGIPLVTRVGQQFAARNSYTMMMNAGITEGIAWTGDEYVEWGLRLGKDAHLRQQIRQKLWQSRQTSPLWNAKQFTQEIERAYWGMWNRFSDG